MGSYIEINDTLRITKEQGFPKELDYEKHISVKGGYFNAKMFEGKVFEFKEKPGVRLFKIPPVRNFLVEYTKDGKWLYWGMCHILETTCNYENQTTSGKFKIIYINTPEEMKTTFSVVDRVWENDFFNRNDNE